jgi:flagellar hook-length control protein FliK
LPTTPVRPETTEPGQAIQQPQEVDAETVMRVGSGNQPKQGQGDPQQQQSGRGDGQAPPVQTPEQQNRRQGDLDAGQSFRARGAQPAEPAGADEAPAPQDIRPAVEPGQQSTFLPAGEGAGPESSTLSTSAPVETAAAGAPVEAIGPSGSANGPTAPSAGPSLEAQALPQPDVDHLATRAVRWQRLGVLDGQGAARIRLAPPELGTVEIQMRSSGSTLTLQMTVDSEPVRQLLQSQSDRLMQSLQHHGFQASRVEISVSNPSESAAEQDAGQSHPDGRGAGADRQDEGGRRGRDDRQDRSFANQMQEELNITA